jgi:hypothetical protein
MTYKFMHYIRIKFICLAYIYGIKILQKKIYRENYFAFFQVSSFFL